MMTIVTKTDIGVTQSDTDTPVDRPKRTGITKSGECRFAK